MFLVAGNYVFNETVSPVVEQFHFYELC